MTDLTNGLSFMTDYNDGPDRGQERGKIPVDLHLHFGGVRINNFQIDQSVEKQPETIGGETFLFLGVQGPIGNVPVSTDILGHPEVSPSVAHLEHSTQRNDTTKA